MKLCLCPLLIIVLNIFHAIQIFGPMSFIWELRYLITYIYFSLIIIINYNRISSSTKQRTQEKLLPTSHTPLHYVWGYCSQARRIAWVTSLWWCWRRHITIYLRAVFQGTLPWRMMNFDVKFWRNWSSHGLNMGDAAQVHIVIQFINDGKQICKATAILS